MILDIDFKDGHIQWDLLSEVDLDKPIEKQRLSEDLLWVQYSKFSIDVGWYRDTFIIYVIENGRQGWEQPWEKSLVQDPKDLISKIQSTVNYWTNNELLG